jgi:hypothetical protein
MAVGDLAQQFRGSVDPMISLDHKTLHGFGSTTGRLACSSFVRRYFT